MPNLQQITKSSDLEWTPRDRVMQRILNIQLLLAERRTVQITVGEFTTKIFQKKARSSEWIQLGLKHPKTAAFSSARSRRITVWNVLWQALHLDRAKIKEQYTLGTPQEPGLLRRPYDCCKKAPCQGPFN